MDEVFTVFFDERFWVGVLESRDEGRLVVARHVFGPEPSNPELLDFMLHRFADMRRFSRREGGGYSGADDSPGAVPREGPRNPKRAQREARRELVRPPSTKAQAALAAARDEGKAERAVISREERLASEARRFELRSEKRKRKHAGR